MRFRKTKLLVLEGDAVFEHLHELAALRIQAAITEVDNWRLGLFADEYARCRGHYLPIVVTGEGRELCRFHERGFLAGIDSRSFHWRQRGIRHRIRVEPGSGNDDVSASRRRRRSLAPATSYHLRCQRHGVSRLPVATCVIGPPDFSSLSSLSSASGRHSPRVKRCNEGILSEAGFDKTTERNPRQRRSKSKSNFRRHAPDENEFVLSEASLLLQFCNVSLDRLAAHEAAHSCSLANVCCTSMLLLANAYRTRFTADRTCRHRRAFEKRSYHPFQRMGCSRRNCDWRRNSRRRIKRLVRRGLRGDINRIIIGPRSNVQDNAVVHLDTNYPTTLGELVTSATPQSCTHARSTTKCWSAWAPSFSTMLKSVRARSSAQTPCDNRDRKFLPAHSCSVRLRKSAGSSVLMNKRTSPAGPGATSKLQGTIANFTERLAATKSGDNSQFMKIIFRSALVVLFAVFFDQARLVRPRGAIWRHASLPSYNH